MPHREAILTALADAPRKFVCDRCLATRLRAPVTAVVEATFALHQEARVRTRYGVCAACRNMERVIGLSDG